MRYKAPLSLAARIGIVASVCVVGWFVYLAITDQGWASLPRKSAFGFVAVVFVLIAYSMYQASRAAQPPAGCCGACGYDLTGNESGTCPECGAEVSH